MLTIYYSFPQLWATFATKLMKRLTIFYIFWNFHFISTYWQNFVITIFFKKKIAPVSICQQNPATIQQLWTIFSTKIMKNPSMFLTYFSSSFQFLHYHAVLLRPRLYNKNDRDFNVANKLLLISKSIFFTPYLPFTFPNICNFR